MRNNRNIIIALLLISSFDLISTLVAMKFWGFDEFHIILLWFYNTAGLAGLAFGKIMINLGLTGLMVGGFYIALAKNKINAGQLNLVLKSLLLFYVVGYLYQVLTLNIIHEFFHQSSLRPLSIYSNLIFLMVIFAMTWRLILKFRQKSAQSI